MDGEPSTRPRSRDHVEQRAEGESIQASVHLFGTDQALLEGDPRSEQVGHVVCDVETWFAFAQVIVCLSPQFSSIR